MAPEGDMGWSLQMSGSLVYASAGLRSESTSLASCGPRYKAFLQFGRGNRYLLWWYYFSSDPGDGSVVRFE